jgi:hypothetical protein
MTHSVVLLAGVEPISWVIGGTALLILVGLLVALVAFGGGREHS